MGRDTSKSYGRVVGAYMGYKLRILFKEGTLPSGKFGIFAGKEKLDEVSKLADAPKKIDKLLAQKHPKKELMSYTKTKR